MKTLCLSLVIAAGSASGILAQDIDYPRRKLPEDQFLSYLGTAAVAAAACPGLAANEQFANGYVRATGVAPEFHRAFGDSMDKAQEDAKRDLNGFCGAARTLLSLQSRVAAVPLLVDSSDKPARQK
ncbi:hypothetical protein M2267_001161 [Ensifer sp. KUDG1]|uniref:hypothetical protein n=1 Tax=unclassified Ensifer TaxID=2633371 RepID=UPI0005BE9B79|nr:hypothetical protein [Ensifer sp. ZNC0028]